MKKILLIFTVVTLTANMASAQLLPSFQFGLKGGMNFASLSSSTAATFSSSNQSGYLGGLWMRFGALGFNFQPEIYATSKKVDFMNNGGETKQSFTSIDVPLLIGGKVGAFGIGGRFYAGPVVSFAVNKDQSFIDATQKAGTLNYHDQNYAVQAGVGLDIKKFSIDLRYEAGLNKQDLDGYPTRINLFTLSIAYSLLKF